jgi:copper homeostasis protein
MREKNELNTGLMEVIINKFTCNLQYIKKLTEFAMRFLEVAVFNYESAKAAMEAGADRIEVCDNYEYGGLTPPLDFARKACELGGIDVFIMIRQRADNFIYSKNDMEQMIKDIEIFKGIGADGFVFGSLDRNLRIDKSISKEIIEMANPLPVTFHRAFDMCENLEKAAEEIIDCGFKRILTSGGEKNAYEGRFVIRDLISKYGNDIIIMPGGGIRVNNVKELENMTKAKEFHTAGLRYSFDINEPLIYAEDIAEIKKV